LKNHQYNITVEWTGNLGTGTSTYRGYSRDHKIHAGKKVPIMGSSDPSFRGDPDRYNPEELFVASLSQCHMLWFLHLCAEAGITVTAYLDRALGTMEESSDGGGRFVEVILRPEVVIADADNQDQIPNLHHRANQLCFIANSCNFPIRHQGKTMVNKL
jgi:organic hydroperoxide reductase OsmC/OhrA